MYVLILTYMYIMPRVQDVGLKTKQRQTARSCPRLSAMLEDVSSQRRISFIINMVPYR